MYPVVNPIEFNENYWELQVLQSNPILKIPIYFTGPLIVVHLLCCHSASQSHWWKQSKVLYSHPTYTQPEHVRCHKVMDDLEEVQGKWLVGGEVEWVPVGSSLHQDVNWAIGLVSLWVAGIGLGSSFALSIFSILGLDVADIQGQPVFVTTQ